LPPRRNGADAAGQRANDFDTEFDTEFDLENVPNELLSEPDIQLPAPDPKPANTRPEIEIPNADGAHSGTPSFLRENVEQLRLNAARISTHQAGADLEKLLIVVEPRTEKDQYIELSAPVKVSIEDVDKEGVEARLGSWEFDAIEIGRTLRKSNMGQGIHLALDWPPDVPLVDDLRVVVTYTRLDGQEIRQEKILHPKTQASTVAGWVPAARSQEVSIGPVDDPPTNDTDPFALAQRLDSEPAPTIFQTVPIPTSMDAETISQASWTEPIANAQHKLSPISVAKLPSVEQRIFGDEAQNEVDDEPTAEPAQFDTRPSHRSVEEANHESQAVPNWTPYR
jgi:hypothetical protein